MILLDIIDIFLMNLKYKLFLFAVCMTEVSFCQTEEVNSTLSSRREILERQAHNAYINACLRLQELSNWISVVLKIKSVWVSSKVNKFSAKLDRALNEADPRNVRSLPPRPKINGSECSGKSVLVTARTYVHLQSQLLLLKMILGRNIVETGKVKLDDVRTSLMERMKTFDIFNDTLNSIINKLKQSTQELSTQVSPENWKSWNIYKEQRFLEDPKNIREKKELSSSKTSQEQPENFQILGKT